jgi:hypothetical protein
MNMAKQIKSIQKKTLSTPDEVRTFDKGKVEVATVGTVTFGRASFEPGWKWSESVKPIVKTEYCGWRRASGGDRYIRYEAIRQTSGQEGS